MHLLRCLFFIRAQFPLGSLGSACPGAAEQLGRCHFPQSPALCLLPGARGCQPALSHFTQPVGPTSGAAAQLDLCSLDPTVRALFSAGVAASTQAVYRTGSRRFLQFCETYQISAPFPVTERILSAFLAHLHTAGLAPGTAKSYLAAVRHAQIAQGFGDPCMGSMPQLEYVVKGMKRTSRSAASRTRLPITPKILARLREVWAAGPTAVMGPCCGLPRACAPWFPPGWGGGYPL